MDQSLSFQPLLFGGDINVYSVARAFHEAYGVRSVAFGKYPSFPCHGSAILDYRVCPDNESDEAFLRNARGGGRRICGQDRPAAGLRRQLCPAGLPATGTICRKTSSHPISLRIC